MASSSKRRAITDRATATVGAIANLGTVPGGIAVGIWLLSPLVSWLDTRFPEWTRADALNVFAIDRDTAGTVLSTIASSSITTLGLVYSLVLVVFTTAASNIGPRLLQRFTSEPVNQITAGLFGGTFLFSLTALILAENDLVPRLSLAVAFVLAAISVLQLIYFVHRASRSVTVDNEVAEIAVQFEEVVSKLAKRDSHENLDSRLDHDVEGTTLFAAGSGYIGDIDIEPLIGLAREEDVFISFLHAPGDFLVPGQAIARLDREVDDDKYDEIDEVLREAVQLARNRTPAADVAFSLNLLVEIGLRALSPGVNDTFTAIACVDRMTSAMEPPMRDGLRDQYRLDDDDTPRLFMPGMSAQDLLDTGFHPIRRASRGNVLMSMHIIDALGRLSEIASDEMKPRIADHARLVLAGNANANLLDEDLQFLEDRRYALFGRLKAFRETN